MHDAPVRAVVVDDEPGARDVILTLLAAHPRVVVAAQATNGREAVDIIRREQPDLLFLDVQMPDLDGFRVLEALGADVPRGVIFVTAHDEHAIRAFDVHALDYILKPFGRPRFDAAVRRALERLRALDALTLQRTLESMALDRLTGDRPTGEVAGSANRRIGVRVGAKTILVEMRDIDWIEACGDYARIHAGDQSWLVSQRMNALETLLVPADDFLRIHRSLIVNVDRIRELKRDPDGGGVIVLHNGVQLRVARGRWDALRTTLHTDA